MPKYRVDVGYRVPHYTTIVVNAADEIEAGNLALDHRSEYLPDLKPDLELAGDCEVLGVARATLGEEITYPDNEHSRSDCTCRLSPVRSTDIDPPDMIVDRLCPLHGDGGPDPDQQRDDRMERI